MSSDTPNQQPPTAPVLETPATPPEQPAPVDMAPIARIAPTMAQMPPPERRADVEVLSEKELGMLRQVEAVNRQLTIELGDAVMAQEAKRSTLAAHRTQMQEAYAHMLRVRGIAEGSFDTSTGVIHVIRRHG